MRRADRPPTRDATVAVSAPSRYCQDLPNAGVATTFDIMSKGGALMRRGSPHTHRRRLPRLQPRGSSTRSSSRPSASAHIVCTSSWLVAALSHGGLQTSPCDGWPPDKLFQHDKHLPRPREDTLAKKSTRSGNATFPPAVIVHQIAHGASQSPNGPIGRG